MSPRARATLLSVLAAGTLACSRPAELGRDGQPPCVVCTDNPPYWRACVSTRIAAGGQPVCEDLGDSKLCVRRRDCQSAKTTR